MKLVRINTDDSMNEISIQSTKNIVSILSKDCTNSSGSSKLQELYTWNYNGETIYCYGWYEGEAGFENKHDLIPGGTSEFLEEDSSEKLLFGNIFLVKKNKQNKYVDFCVSDYAHLYNELFEGFDECHTDEEEDDEDEEPDEDDKDFIVDTDEEESDDSYEYKEDEELDIDENEY
jgi:hypothetical protein